MGKRFLFVTANSNERAALLEDKEFYRYRPDVRSANQGDALFYDHGYFGKYEVIHFQIPQQGSVRADASLPSIMTAIDAWNPDAVILVGIAFGKDNDASPEPRQHIGDVLISTSIADYESGKVRDGEIQSDAPVPEPGRHLLSVFTHYSRTWNYNIGDRAARCYPGMVLSGDKVVDDADFKANLFRTYRRAVGGEMEGRGAYAACRHKALDEWIVVKAICDWGENKSNSHKEEDQITASKSAVALLKYIFSDEHAFDHLPSKQRTLPKDPLSNEDPPPPLPIGYCINIGTTSCRLFEVLNNKTLKETVVSTYDVNDPEDDDYLDGIIAHVKKELLPRMQGNPAHLLQKVFVDSDFADIFSQHHDQTLQKDFTRKFYEETNLYFNVLSKTQTEENLKRLFHELPNRTAIINVGARGVDILRYDDGKFHMHSIEITLADIMEYARLKNFPEVWTEPTVDTIKDYIRGRIGHQLDDVKVDNSIIIKGELEFMQNLGYPLKMETGQLSLTQRVYKQANREKLFFTDYLATLKSQHGDDTAVRRLHGFKFGHLLIETMLDAMRNKRVLPKNDLSIHGNHINAYIFNVVISGSTHGGREMYMLEAHDIVQKMEANVLSPPIIDGKLSETITADTEYAHLKAIDECDVLFICNRAENGYIGESTKCEIYYAYALRKTIAFWHEPPADKRLSFIPHEHWGAIRSLVA